jgi:hypothetical protein
LLFFPVFCFGGFDGEDDVLGLGFGDVLELLELLEVLGEGGAGGGGGGGLGDGEGGGDWV